MYNRSITDPYIADLTNDCVMLQVFSSGTIYVYRNMFREDRDFQLEAVAEHTNEEDLKSALIDRNSLKLLNRKHFSNGAMFGASLINLKRLDGDPCEDFAVGAPYEDDGEGAVYVNRGSKTLWWNDGKLGKTIIQYLVDIYWH